jgi:cupin 2 domain-containing protein
MMKNVLKASNIFENVPKPLENESFETILSKNNLKIERIVSKGHISPESGWYNQEQDEWVIIMQGAATISFKDGNDVHLKAGTHLNIPAHTPHQVSWTDPNLETIWLAVHY